MITETAVAAGINLVYLQTLLRVIGIAYLAEFRAALSMQGKEASLHGLSWRQGHNSGNMVPVIVEIMESVLG